MFRHFNSFRSKSNATSFASREEIPRYPATPWSDGRYLVAQHANNVDLLLYDFSAQKWSVLVKEIGPIGYMEWAQDSKSVLFDTLGVTDPSFFRIHLADQRRETVVHTQDIRRYYGEFGPWTGMAPDGSPLLVRDISSEEVYALDLQLP